MPEILIKSRITPPRLRADIIHRTRLINQLKANMDKSVVLICTSAGFGKTTLALDFLSGTPYGWYYVSADVNSFYSFFTHIIHSIRRLSDRFGKNTLQLVKTLQQTSALSKDSESSINELTASFINEFMDCFDDDIILLIDDLHNIDVKKNFVWLNYFFNTMFDTMPGNLHFIITTRTVPGFNISKLKAKRRIFELGTDELTFDRVEIIELLEKVYSIDSAGVDIGVLQANMNGWITGIHLILQAHGKEFREPRHGVIHDYEEIFNYFAQDIFENLDVKTREFLLNTAALEDFDPAICNVMLDIDYSEEVIKELIKKNIFIQHSTHHNTEDSSSSNHYSYLELFRLFLLAKQRELKSKKEIDALLGKLFDYYISINQFVPAVKYGLKAEDYARVIPVIAKNYRALFDTGHYDILWQWISLIPADMAKEEATIMYLTGLLNLYFRADPEGALKYASEAMVLANCAKNNSLLVDCSILKTEAMLLLGKSENLKEELKQVLGADISKAETVKLLYYISRILYREGFSTYNEIIKVLTESLEICNEENIELLKTDIFTMLGNVYNDWGDPVKAVYYYEQALIYDTDVYKKFRAMNNLVYQYCLLGKYSNAKEYLDKSKELHDLYPSLLFKRYLLRSTGMLSGETGDFEECIRKFQELISLEIKNNIKQYAGTYYMWIGDMYYYLKRYDAAMKNYEIALNHIEKSDEEHILLNSYGRARILLAIDCKRDMEEIFLETMRFHEKNNMLAVKFQIEYTLANYYLKAGSRDTALKYLKSCLDFASGRRFLSFFDMEVLNTPEVFDFALANNIHKQFIKTIFENVRDKLSYRWLSNECKKRLARELESLTAIKLYSFGRTGILLRGVPIEEQKWVRKKSKLILAYLLTKPGMLLYKDKIIDMFLQDIPLESVDTVFHNTISNIRSAVRIDYSGNPLKNEKGGVRNTGKAEFTPQFIIYEDRNLSLNKDYHYDSDCLEFERLFNQANSASTGKEKKIEDSISAVELYKGEFLPGHYEPWCDEMRENYENMYGKLLENLLHLLYSEGRYEDTIKYASKLLESDRLHPEAYLKLIESYACLGNIAAAKDKLALMLKNYEEELGEKPEKQLLDNINDILEM